MFMKHGTGGLLARLFIIALGVCGVVTMLLHRMALQMDIDRDNKLVNTLKTFAKSDSTNERKKRNKRRKRTRNRREFKQQYELLDEYDSLFPRSDTKRMLAFVEKQRKRQFKPIDSSMKYDVFNCPLHPPRDYPMQWKILDIIDNWNPDDTEPREKIYQGLCIFNYATEFEKANNYRKAEVPFILRDDPEVLQAAERWAHPDYLHRLLAPVRPQRTEYNKGGNHFMYWNNRGRAPEGWEPPTENIKMNYDEWLRKANAPNSELDVDKPHWYFRLNGNICEKNDRDCGHSNEFLYDELPFFEPVKSFYMVDPRDHRGINCRFGMKGVIAENHFDGSRNFIVLLGGERRYILAHPNQCRNLCLYPKHHPSGRHSAVDWSNPDLEQYPKFKKAMANEVVLQAGDALYLPTSWFHYIINLGVNYQCNARSGLTFHYENDIRNCGF